MYQCPHSGLSHFYELLPQEELTPQSIALLRNYSRSQLLAMAEQARTLAKPNATRDVAQLCSEVAR